MKVLLIVATAVLLAAMLLQSAHTPLQIYDDPLWYQRSQRPIWKTDGPKDYHYAVDVPGGCRFLYGITLDLFGLDGLPCRMPDYNLPDALARNSENMCFAPADVTLALRGCNMLFFWGGLACLYMVAFMLLKKHTLAALAVAPLVMSPRYPVEIVPRLGPDTFLAAMLCVSLFLWMLAHVRGKDTTWWFAVAIGVLGGLCAWEKINGALVLVAYLGYAVTQPRHLRGLLLGLAALSVGGAVFYLLNPAFLMHSPAIVLRDIISRRRFAAMQLEGIYPLMGWTRVFEEAVHCWAMLPLLAVFVWKAARVPGMAPLLWWGGALVIGNLSIINLPLPRYTGPVELGLYFTASVALCLLLVRPGQPEQHTASKRFPTLSGAFAWLTENRLASRANEQPDCRRV